MNRRTALRNSAILGLSTVLLRQSLFAGTAAKPLNSFYRFPLGDLTLTVVTDGHILFKPVQPGFAPGIDSNKVSALLHDNFLSEKEVDLSINVLVVTHGQKNILIDTGCGFNFGDASGWLPKNLAIAGISPAAVTDVVLSHAHPDHLGGLLTKDNQLVFPNAAIHISRIENEFWLSPNPDFSKSRLNNPGLKKMVIDIAQHTLTTIKPMLHFFEDNQTLLDCIKVRIVPGHTPGHTVSTIISGGEELVHVADLVHSPVLVFAHPEWGFEGDTDFQLAVASRKKTLEELAHSRAAVFSYHLPWPGLGHVKKEGTGYAWVQKEVAIPQ